MLKFDRNYKAVFTIGHRNPENFREMIDDEIITVQYPFSVNLSIDTGVYSTSNSGQFQFYNLSKNDQKKLWFDLYETGKKYIKLEFYAGYQNTMPLIFSGFVSECVSYRDAGSPTWITSVDAFNAGDFFKYGTMNATFSKGTTLGEILKVACEGEVVKPGYVSPEIKPLPTNKTFIGQTMDLLAREFAGYNVYVDNNELNIIGDNEVVPGEIEVLTDSTGLLGSPRRANLFLEVDLLFSPQLKAGQAISLLSNTMPQFNRAYEISNIKHQGIISPSVAGVLNTKLTLTMFSSDLKEVKTLKKVADTEYTENKPDAKGWIKPVNYSRVSSSYGWRIHPIKKEKKFHEGVDLAAPMSTSIYAAKDGKVIFSGWKGGYGRYITIDHGKNNNVILTSGYGHMSKILISQGQQVIQGQEIAQVGQSGYATGPHLHFEVRENGSPVNPNKYVKLG